MGVTVRQYWSFGGIFILKLTEQLNWHFFQQKTSHYLILYYCHDFKTGK